MLCGTSVRVRGRGRGAGSPIVEGERGLILFVGGGAGELVVRRELDMFMRMGRENADVPGMGKVRTDVC